MVALAVAARRREIGIRVAVGADWVAVTKSVAGPMGVAVLIGLGAGLMGAFAAMQLVGSLLWSVAPADPMSLTVGVGMLVAAIALAAAVPLRQAMRADPVSALRAV